MKLRTSAVDAAGLEPAEIKVMSAPERRVGGARLGRPFRSSRLVPTGHEVGARSGAAGTASARNPVGTLRAIEFRIS